MEQDAVATIVDLIGGKGQRRYGLSAIDRRAHALQTALLAEQAGCDPALSLGLQGGPMSAGEIAAFESQPYYGEAVQLRRFDEGAEVKGLQVPDDAHYVPHIRACLLKGKN
jgi:predicted HD phosphohydrolase